MAEQTIMVLSKPQFDNNMVNNNITDENVETFDKVAFISVTDTSGQWSESYFKMDHDNVIRFQFDDVSNEMEISPTNKNKCYPISEDQANRLFKFIKKHKNRSFLVHCAAGISRSGAIGQFINDYLNLDKGRFLMNNPHILPNGHISRLLNNLVWNE
jgi:predicted protein tyrosine phosphatase